jgi:hypothetical protein
VLAAAHADDIKDAPEPLRWHEHHTSLAAMIDIPMMVQVSCGHENVRFWRIRRKHLPACPAILNEFSRGTHFTDLAFESSYGKLDDEESPKVRSMLTRGCSHTAMMDHDHPQVVFVATNVGTIIEISYHTRDLLCVLRLHNDAINCLAVNEGFVVTGSNDRYMRLWPLDFSDYLLEAQNESPVTTVSQPPLSPPAPLLACCPANEDADGPGTLVLWLGDVGGAGERVGRRAEAAHRHVVGVDRRAGRGEPRLHHGHALAHLQDHLPGLRPLPAPRRVRHGRYALASPHLHTPGNRAHQDANAAGRDGANRRGRHDPHLGRGDGLPEIRVHVPYGQAELPGLSPQAAHDRHGLRQRVRLPQEQRVIGHPLV